MCVCVCVCGGGGGNCMCASVISGMEGLQPDLYERFRGRSHTNITYKMRRQYIDGKVEKKFVPRSWLYPKIFKYQQFKFEKQFDEFNSSADQKEE